MSTVVLVPEKSTVVECQFSRTGRYWVVGRKKVVQSKLERLGFLECYKEEVTAKSRVPQLVQATLLGL